MKYTGEPHDMKYTKKVHDTGKRHDTGKLNELFRK
jgi:hypothetical protein